MLDYARWKYWLVAIVLLISLIFALPNVFGDERALQIARKDRAPMDVAQLTHVTDVLKQHGVVFTGASLEKGAAIVRFANDTEQLKARDVAKDESAGLAKDYVNAMMYASRAPAWLQALGLRAMPLASTCAAASIFSTRWTSTARWPSCSTATIRMCGARCAPTT